MSNPLRAPRGTTASITSRVLLDGEMAYNVNTDQLHVGDGVTMGGLVTDLQQTGYGARIAALEAATQSQSFTLTYSQDGAAVGPFLDLYRVSASPAASDLIGALYFNGHDSAGNKTLYGSLETTITDPTDGSEDARVDLYAMRAGTKTSYWRTDGSMVGAPANLTNTIAGQPAPDFGYSLANLKIYHRSEIICEESDTSEIALRRVNGTLTSPTNLSINDLIGVIYFQGYINSAWGSNSPNYARSAQIQSRYMDPNTGKSGGTLGFGVTPINSDVIRLRTFLHPSGKFTHLGRGALEDASLDDTNYVPPGAFTVLAGTIANEKGISLRVASATTYGHDWSHDTGTGVLRSDAVSNGISTTYQEVNQATGNVAWFTRHTNTGQPAFLAGRSSDMTDATGDGTEVTFIGNSEVADQGAGHDASTGVYTAPATGLYKLGGFLQLSGVLAGHTRITFKIVTSNRTYFLDVGDIPIDVNGRVGLPFAVLADMDANDTATLRVVVDGSTKVVDILWGASGIVQSCFYGHLVC